MTARATFCTDGMKRARSSGSMSKSLRAGAFGMTSVWPSARGITSMKASETIVLVDLDARRFAAQDLGEDVVWIIRRRQRHSPTLLGICRRRPRRKGAWSPRNGRSCARPPPLVAAR